MIDRAPFGATGHESSRVIFGAAALGDVSKADADRTLERAARARHQPHRRRRQLRRRGAADRHLADASTGRSSSPPRPGERTYAAARGGDPPLARPARRRPRRLDPAAQPRRRDRVGHRAQPRRRARGVRRGARGRPASASSASPATASSCPKMHQRSLERFDFDSVLCPYNLVQMQDPRYAETFDAARRDLRRAQRRAADDQEPRARPGRAASTPRRPGTSRSPSRPTSTWPCTGCSATRRFPAHHRRRRACCRSCSTRPSAPATPDRRRRWPRSTPCRCSPSAVERRRRRTRGAAPPAARAGRPSPRFGWGAVGNARRRYVTAARSRSQPASAVAVIGRPR